MHSCFLQETYTVLENVKDGVSNSFINLTGDMPLDVMKISDEGKQMTMMKEEVLCKSETLALKKLGLPSRIEAYVETERASLRSAPNIPRNNPFKKRKKDDEAQPNQTMAAEEQASEVQPNQRIASEEQASEVIEVEKSEFLSSTQKSEESVDSKPKGKRIDENLSKQTASSHVTPKRWSILNFFSRV